MGGCATCAPVRLTLLGGVNMSQSIIVDGKPHEVRSSPDTPLLYVLRNELRLNGPKFGCGLAQCGACTVHMGDAAIRSCLFPISAVAQPITTLEGLEGNGK